MRRATARELCFIRDLQRRFSSQLGFLPTAALEQYLAWGQVLVSRENGDAAGAIVFRPGLRCQPTTASIVQAAVCMDAQRRQHGLDLLSATLSRLPTTTEVVQCWCAEELEANEFWLAAGFRRVAVRTPGNTRRRRLLLWRLPMNDASDLRCNALPDRCGFKARKSHNESIIQSAGIEDSFDLSQLPRSWRMDPI